MPFLGKLKLHAEVPFLMCITQKIFSYDFGVSFDDVHGNWVAELAKVAQYISTVVLDGPLHHLGNERVKSKYHQ